MRKSHRRRKALDTASIKVGEYSIAVEITYDMITDTSFADILTPGLRAVYLYKSELERVERLAKDMRWSKSKETRWALIGPVACDRETDRALLVRYAPGGLIAEAGHWIPKSMLHDTENEVTQVGDMGMLVIPEWLAKQRGWL